MRINIELDGRVLDELFLWDNNEPYLSINMFAQILVEEHNLPISFEQEIVNEMNKKIRQFRIYKPIMGEILRTIKLNVRIENMVLKDQFEWGIFSRGNIHIYIYIYRILQLQLLQI